MYGDKVVVRYDGKEVPYDKRVFIIKESIIVVKIISISVNTKMLMRYFKYF